MKLISVVAALALIACATQTAAQAPAIGAIRPDPAITTTISSPQTTTIALPFNIRMGAEAPFNNVRFSTSGSFGKAGDFGDNIDNLFAYDIRPDTGVATYGYSSVNGRNALIVSYRDLGYSQPIGNPGRGSSQIVVIDRSDVSPGDFDFEINIDDNDEPSFYVSYRIDGAILFVDELTGEPANTVGIRYVLSFRNGVLSSAVRPDVNVPAPVPTMTEWAMILFGAALAGGAALYIQRRRQFA